VEVVADGANAAQMPELQLPAIDGAQVFAEPVQADETFRDGRPGVKLTRRFSIVPARAGTMALPGMALSCWDVAAGVPRRATLPPLRWTVAAAANADPISASAPAAGSATGTMNVLRRSDDRLPGSNRTWIMATLLFGVERLEIDRLQEERREAAILHEVRNDLTSIREQHVRAIRREHGIAPRRIESGQTEDAGLMDFRQVRGLVFDLARRGHAEHDFERGFAELRHALRKIQLDIRLRLLRLENLRCARRLEGDVLDVDLLQAELRLRKLRLDVRGAVGGLCHDYCSF
jgi:hypothetical protein